MENPGQQQISNIDEQLNKQYDIDRVFFLGCNETTGAIVYHAKKKQPKKIFAIRFYPGKEKGKERPPYIQWCESRLLSPDRELLPYFATNFDNCIGNPALDLLQKLKLMHAVAKKLSGYHEQEKIHGNIHPQNVMLSKNLKEVEFLDSLKQGNIKTYYCSPESYQGVNHQASDIYSLGLIFLELLDSRKLDEELLPIKKPPHRQPLFPQQCHFENIQHAQVKELLRLMLNRSYLERIRASQIVEILRAIILNMINKNQNQKVDLDKDHVTSFFEVQLNLLEFEKKEEDKDNQLIPANVSQEERKIFDMYPKAEPLTFTRRWFTFTYNFGNNQLGIIYQHPAGDRFKVEYLEKQLPKQVKEKMGMRKLLLVLLHTPLTKFELCLTGKLIIRISNNYKEMYFGGSS